MIPTFDRSSTLASEQAQVPGRVRTFRTQRDPNKVSRRSGSNLRPMDVTHCWTSWQALQAVHGQCSRFFVLLMILQCWSIGYLDFRAMIPEHPQKDPCRSLSGRVASGPIWQRQTPTDGLWQDHTSGHSGDRCTDRGPVCKTADDSDVSNPVGQGTHR